MPSWRSLLLLLLLVACVNNAHSARGDVLRGEEDAALSSLQRRLQQNSDAPAISNRSATMQDLVPSNYPLEQHKVYTEDGWVLRMFRIPRGGQRRTEPGQRPVVLLLHGLTLSSACFALFNPNESMAYILADAGFDVWMGNTRSNDYSRGNLHYSFRDPEYWYVSMDELALIDLPAMINYALGVSGAKKLGLLTHSQGSALGYAMSAVMPEMNAKVSVMLNMGPSIFLDFFRGAFLRRWVEVRNDKMFELAQLGEFLPSRWMSVFTPQCRDWTLSETCLTAINLMFFGFSALVPPDDYMLIYTTWPSTVSARNIIHTAQWISDKRLRFTRFDYGTNCTNRTNYHETCNQQKYGSMEPPEYDLSKVHIPVVIMQGELDIMVPDEDVQEQLRRLPNASVVVYQQYSHMDFVWDRNVHHALDAVDLFYRFSAGSYD